MGLEIGKMNENELCAAAKAGDSDAVEVLVSRYSRLVKTCARAYYLAGAEGDDLIQEGMLGLWRAVISFDPDRGVPFEAYAHTCISRRIYSAVRDARALKHEPLNTSLSLEKPLFEDNAESHSGNAAVSDPEALVISMEEQSERLRRLRELLSVFEAQVLSLYLEGFSYDEIAARLKKSRKSVDNAIQRIRRKSASVNL
ncbi:MAG: sigma-70 family RNA polymerase sigma factor [Butyricicoccus sp.]|nr:sigma-70 family RNA polymerase sigma factor [Butyricicoccus sp.]